MTPNSQRGPTAPARPALARRALPLALLTVLAGCGGETTRPVDPPIEPPADSTGPAGRIAFQSTRDQGTWDIYVMNADGGDVRRLTADPADDQEPAISPDGRQIAFASARGRVRRFSIYVMNADGTGVTRLTSDEATSDVEPAWSPDGTRLLFRRVVLGGGGSGLYTVGVDGSGLAPVPGTDGAGGAAWSPDGRLLAARFAGTDGIVVQGLDGTGRRVVADPQGVDADPAWSPDGTRIAWGAVDDGWNDVLVAKADGTEQTSLTRGGTDDGQPSWSPDGEWIAYTSDRGTSPTGSNPEIAIRRADGTGQRVLTRLGALDAHPSWGRVP